MKTFLHQLEGGVFFLFVATIASWMVILFVLGLGLAALWLTTIAVVYFIGKSKGSEEERRRQSEFDHKITRMRERL